MNTSDLKTPGYFTKNGNDIWKLESFCLEPTCTLKNIETGEISSFGIGGLISESFHPITMPEIK